MSRIYKYRLRREPEQTVELPSNSEILSVQLQGNEIVLWAEVDPTSKPRVFTFHIVGTGWNVPENSDYLGTVQDGEFVWHVMVSS